MYVNGTAGTQDNSAPPIATVPGMDGMVAHNGFTPARLRRSEISCSIRSTRPKSSGG